MLFAGGKLSLHAGTPPLPTTLSKIVQAIPPPPPPPARKSLDIETLRSNNQRIQYIKRNLDKFYTCIKINDTPTTADTVSIVMTASNRSRQTYYTLNSLLTNTHKDIQVIIVDDSSTDRLDQKIIESYPFRIVLIYIKKELKTWVNPCVTYNIGFKFVRGSKVIIQNAEVFHVGQVIDHVVHNTIENEYRVYDVRSSSGFEMNESLYAKPSHTSSLFSELNTVWYQCSETRNKGYHFLTSMSIDVFNRIGGFSYDYSLGDSYDDDDFLLRILANNIQIVSVKHSNVQCGGLHLYHTFASDSWAKHIPFNDIIYVTKLKRFEKEKIYTDLI
jgi:glycosyltransferase involved in cell wall biosynthesis